jgi:hypothetical protein
MRTSLGRHTATDSQSWLTSVCHVILVTMLVASPATAQSRGATIGVAATVRGLDDASVIGAGALAHGDVRPTAQVVSGRILESGSWRISSGGSPEIGLSVEVLDDAPGGSVPYVAVCDEGEGGGDCRYEPSPTLRMDSGKAESYVVRVRWKATGHRGTSERRPVRLTVAYTAI